MKKLLLLLLLLLAVPLVYADEFWCYQETANVSSSCGGLASGRYAANHSGDVSHPFSMMYDGDWGTYYGTSGTWIAYANWTYPVFVANTSVYQVKLCNAGPVNISLSKCFLNPSQLQFQYAMTNIGYIQNVDVSCYNGTTYELLYSDPCGTYAVFEEAMWWYINRSIEIDNCSAYNTTVFSFSIYNEDSPALPLNATVDVDINYYLNDSSLLKYYNTRLSGNSTYNICINDANTPIMANIYLKYQTDNGFTHRYYSFQTNLTNSTTSVNIYNYNTTTGLSELRITTRYPTYQFFSGVHTLFQRYYPNEGVWRTVQEDLSDTYGLNVFHIKEQTTDYRLIFKDQDNNVLETSDKSKFACTSSVCDITYLVDEYTATEATDNITGDVVYDNDTRIITFNWTIPSGNSHTIRLRVRKETTGSPTYICDTTQYGSSGYITCNTTGHSGHVYTLVEMNSVRVVVFSRYIELTLPPLSSVIDPKEGAFYTFLMCAVTVAAGIFSAAGAVIMLLIGLIISALFGFSSITNTTFLFGAFALGVIIAVRVHK